MSARTELELEVEAARRKLQELERRLHEEEELRTHPHNNADSCAAGNGEMSNNKENGAVPSFVSAGESLTTAGVERYSRQMMVDGIGAAGMERIRHGRVLLVGAGGLGSTIAMFLAAAGVGELKIVDFDVVELSNLHRQIIHTTDRVGMKKVESAAGACYAINPDIVIRPLNVAFDASNAEDLVRDCDVVVDGTDNVTARYLINDAAARQKKPVVSGSAMRWEGQLSVYAYNGGPCLRCLFPVPPPPAAVGSCNDTGVVGAVPGCIGCLQAMEVMKILANAGNVLSGRMLLFDGLRFNMRVVNLRGRQETCVACGDGADVRTPLRELAATRPEYIGAKCTPGSVLSAQLLPSGARILPRDASARIQGVTKAVGSTKCIVLDVRAAEQYDMAHLPTAASLPLAVLQKWQRNGELRSEWEKFVDMHLGSTHDCVDVLVICRRGIASTEAVRILMSIQQQECEKTGGSEEPKEIESSCRRYRFMNVEGGLNRYHHEVDHNFPFY